jgi:hypothetical protein
LRPAGNRSNERCSPQRLVGHDKVTLHYGGPPSCVGIRHHIPPNHRRAREMQHRPPISCSATCGYAGRRSHALIGYAMGRSQSSSAGWTTRPGPIATMTTVNRGSGARRWAS